VSSHDSREELHDEDLVVEGVVLVCEANESEQKAKKAKVSEPN